MKPAPSDLSLVGHCLFCVPRHELLLLSIRRFRILLATGSIVPGHMVIVPVTHSPSLANPGFEAAAEDLQYVRQMVVAISRSVYGADALFFEHGAACVRKTHHVFCTHGHMHVLPTSLTDEQKIFVLTELQRQFANRMSMSDVEAAAWYDSNYVGEYFYLSAHNEQHVFFPDGVSNPPSRLFRRILARVLGLDIDQVVGWEDQAERQDLASTANKLRAVFRELEAEQTRRISAKRPNADAASRTGSDR